MGNHDKRIPSNDGISSSIGAAEILTPLFVSFSIRLGSPGVYVEKFFPLDKIPLILFP